MLFFLAYSGNEPNWAKAMRSSQDDSYSVYSHGIPFQYQEDSLKGMLGQSRPCATAYTHAEAFKLAETLWLPYDEALPNLIAADEYTETSRIIWRDLYLLVRSDAVVVDINSTNEIAVLAAFLNIPVATVSFQSFWNNPWLAHCSGVTINSPSDVHQIISVFPNVIRNSEEDPEST